MAAPIWQNLITHRTDVDPLELLPQEHNFRIHALNQRQVTTASLDELGHVGDIIVNIRTGKIVNGHLRVELAIAEAQDTVPVTYIDCDEATEKIILAFFDEVGAKAITDADRLKATIAQIDIGSSHLQASLDDWVLSFKPKKGGKRDDDEGEELLDEDDFLDAPAAAPAAAPVAAAPAAAPAAPSAPAEALPVVETAPVVAALEAAPAALRAPAEALPVVEAAPVVAALEAAPAAPSAPVAALPVVEAAPVAADPVEALPVVEAAPVAPPPAPVVVQDDLFAAAIVEDVRAQQAAEAPPAPPAPVVAAPTEYLVKVGEFDQMVPASLFAPWFAALCAQTGNGHTALAAEVKRRLGFE